MKPRRALNLLSLLLAAFLQIAPMLRSALPTLTTGAAPSAWAIILQLGGGTAALLGSCQAVSGASPPTTNAPPYAFTLTNNVPFKRQVYTLPHGSAAFTTNGATYTNLSCEIFPGIFLTNNNGGWVAGTPKQGGTNVINITAWYHYPPGPAGGADQASTSTNYTFTVLGGNLRVTISPASAMTAGACWQLDTNAWQTTSALQTGQPVGAHTINFTNLPGWLSPPSSNISIAVGTTNILAVTYVQNSGALQVNLGPTGAVGSGAKWQVDGGTLQNSGAVVTALAAGSHTIAFNSIAGWVTPTSQSTTISSGVTNVASATYVQVGPPNIDSFYLLGTNVVISGSGTPGASFSILAGNSLNIPSSNWTVVYTSTITGGIFNFTDSVHIATPAALYRVRCP